MSEHRDEDAVHELERTAARRDELAEAYRRKSKQCRDEARELRALLERVREKNEKGE